MQDPNVLTIINVCNLSAMCWIIEEVLCIGMCNSSRIPAHYVEVYPSSSSGSGMPLHLSGTCIQHGGGEDGQHRPRGVQDAFLKNKMVLVFVNA